MSARVISRLVAKDCSLMRLPIAAYTVGALAGLILVAAGGRIGRTAGTTLAVNVLIGVSFHVLLGPVLGERERKTLAFVMSLPVTPRDAALGKLVSAFVLFLIPATLAATALVFLSPVDVFHSMATSDRSVLSHLAGWAAYYVVILGAWLLFFSVVLAAAIVSESIGWTVAVLSGLVFVVSNFVLQVAPLIGWVGRYLRDVAHGGPALPATILVEVVGVVLVVGVMLLLQERKTSFV